MTLNLGMWLLAFLPVLVVLVAMLVLHWNSVWAGAAALVTAILVSLLAFGGNLPLIGVALGKSLLLSADVLFIIWGALLLYHVANEAGAVTVLGSALSRLTPDRMLQGLLLGWVFASFLQGMGGFGVPVAVAAPLLVELGFTPMSAVIMACVGHGWAVNFGSLATSFTTLTAVTGLPGEELAPMSAVLLWAAGYFCGLAVAYLAGGLRGLARSLPAVLLLGTVMGGVQYALAANGLWTLGATGGGMAGLAVAIILPRLPFYRTRTLRGESTLPGDPEPLIPQKKGELPLWLAMAAYLILVALTFGVNLIPGLSAALGRLQVNFWFPETQTALGWMTPAGMGRGVEIFGHPGAMLVYSCALAFWLYWRRGMYKPGAAGRIWQKTVRGAMGSTWGILAMVAMSVVMTHSGMTTLLAQGLGAAFGGVYPLASPLIGALGGFITGSNNSSSVLFGALQRDAARLLGLSVPLILGGQAAGGSVGSIMAPAKVLVGSAAVGLSREEGRVMGRVMVFALPIIGVLAVLVCALSALGWG